MAQIAVIGMSSFGYYLAKSLYSYGSEVLAVDINEAMIDRIKAHVTQAIVADASDREVLEELKLARMDSIVLSLGSNLNTSVLTAMHLKELGAKNIVAKALSEDHVKILELIGVNRVVFPERDMGLRIAASLHKSNVLDYLSLGSNLTIIEMTPLKEMLDKTIIELDFRRRYHCQIMAIRDTAPPERTFIPLPDTKIKASHILIVMGEDDLLSQISRG